MGGPTPPDEPGDDFPRPWKGRQAMRVLGAVTEFTGAATGGVLVGYGVDLYFHTAPWGLVLGSFAGLIAGFYGLYLVVSRFDRPPPPRP